MVAEWFSRAVHTLKQRRHQGQVLILTAAGMIVLLGFVAVSVDVGYALTERRQVQTAVDAAAIAAANAALANADDAVVISTARVYGAENAGVSTDDVDVQRPPTSGDHAGDNNYIQVSIDKDIPRFFTSAVYHGDWTVSASAMSALIPAGFDAAILALNPNSGGIKTSGYTNIQVTGGGSVVSNYNFNTSGNTTIKTDGWIASARGFVKSGSSTLIGGLGTNGSASVMPDPLADKIQPPDLPAFPTNPISDVNPTGNSCLSKPGWYPEPQYPADYTAVPGTYTNCSFNLTGKNPADMPFEFTAGSYKFKNASINDTFDQVQIDGTKMIFDGSSSGISVGSGNKSFVMKKGSYAFLNGAKISISGDSPNSVLGDGASTDGSDNIYYFSGGGGITGTGRNYITLNPGTYIFDGGTGLNMSGNDHLKFMDGEYKFYFRNGAGITFSGSSDIQTVGTPHVQMYFYGSTKPTTTWSDINMSGYTTVQLPSGEYYFDHGRVLASGSTFLKGNNVFFYFKNQGYLQSSGQAGFAFTAPTTSVYDGYYPGVFIYSDRSNPATFTWTGSTSVASQGVIYIPDSPLIMTGDSNQKIFTGQIIADSFNLSGNNVTALTYRQYVETSVPRAFLVK